MENQDIKIGIKTVWWLVLGNLLLTAGGGLAKIYGWEYAQPLLIFGLMLLFSTWVIVINDILRNKIYNKFFLDFEYVYNAVFSTNFLHHPAEQTI